MTDIRLNRQVLAFVDLDKLPGGTELYVELAQIFLHSYEGHQQEYDACGCKLSENDIARIARAHREAQE